MAWDRADDDEAPDAEAARPAQRPRAGPEPRADGAADARADGGARSINRMRGGGEYGELTLELVASLAAHQAPVSAAERDELRELLEAMGMPADVTSGLQVED